MRHTKRDIQLEVHDDASLEIVEQALYYQQQVPDGALDAKWDRAVMAALTSLLTSPERGTLCHFRSQGLRGMRRIPIPGFPNHFIFYLFVSEERMVRIVHVLHGARDLDSFFLE